MKINYSSNDEGNKLGKERTHYFERRSIDGACVRKVQQHEDAGCIPSK